jgi:tryptophanyl-tRNA synthetase
VGGVLERLAVEETCDEQVAFLPQGELVIEIDVGVLREESLALELDQRRCDEEELGGDLEIEVLHEVDLGQVGVDDAGERDLVEIDLLAQDEVEQEVEGALVDRCLHLVRHPVTLEPSGGGPAHHAEPGETGSGARPSTSSISRMARVFSGIKPTGPVQLGNLLGALRHWVVDQEKAETIFCVVDLHALTVPQDPTELRDRTLELAQLLIAIGIDPARTTLFVQSHVPEHAQLSWILECTASFGELRRMTQFKDKSDDAEFVSAGLFTYPALMAADILLYDTDRVPVGDDQRQHLELSRDLAIRFNSRYGETFVVPEAAIPSVGARVMDLQHPTRKMSKSEDSPQGTILVLEDLDAVARKIKRAVTDADTDVRFDPEDKPGVSNLLSILGACTGADPASLADTYTRYGDLKAACAEAVLDTLRPIQQRFAELSADRAGTMALLAAGAERARAIAGPVLERARTNIGLLPPG